MLRCVPVQETCQWAQSTTWIRKLFPNHSIVTLKMGGKKPHQISWFKLHCTFFCMVFGSGWSFFFFFGCFSLNKPMSDFFCRSKNLVLQSAYQHNSCYLLPMRSVLVSDTWTAFAGPLGRQDDSDGNELPVQTWPQPDLNWHALTWCQRNLLSKETTRNTVDTT